jgi:phosphoglycolate phosphatase-like HAD superfamily hydrolase
MKHSGGSRAIVFDLDGTLVDMRALYLRANQLATKEVLGLELSEVRSTELMATGVPLRAAMRSLDENSADRLVEVFVRHYRRERANLLRAFPGMIELLVTLRSQGHPIAVVTSKLRDEARADLLATTMNGSVEVLVAFEDSTEHKPHPEPIIQALDSLRGTRGVGIGDLPTDITAVRAAGLSAIGVSWGYGSTEALLDAGADCVCDSAHDLGLVLDRLVSAER